VEQFSVLLSHFFGCLQYPEIFTPLRQTLFLETAKNYSEPNQGNRVTVPFQFISGPEIDQALSWWRIQSLGQSSVFFNTELHVTASTFQHNKLH